MRLRCGKVTWKKFLTAPPRRSLFCCYSRLAEHSCRIVNRSGIGSGEPFFAAHCGSKIVVVVDKKRLADGTGCVGELENAGTAVSILFRSDLSVFQAERTQELFLHNRGQLFSAVRAMKVERFRAGGGVVERITVQAQNKIRPGGIDFRGEAC